jgi:hypothetical protein
MAIHHVRIKASVIGVCSDLRRPAASPHNGCPAIGGIAHRRKKTVQSKKESVGTEERSSCHPKRNWNRSRSRLESNPKRNHFVPTTGSAGITEGMRLFSRLSPSVTLSFTNVSIQETCSNRTTHHSEAIDRASAVDITGATVTTRADIFCRKSRWRKVSKARPPTSI